MNDTRKMVAPQTLEKIVEDLTLFDDELMSQVFDQNIEATELLLNIILERDDIQVLEVTGQRELKNPVTEGRKVRLDILAIDSDGKYYDVEVQRDNRGAHERRARFNSSMMDTRMLRKKQKFKELCDSYTIFITQKDKMKRGLPIYHIDRVVKETNEPFNDGSHIIYVNGAYKGENALGKLIHDFSCKKPEDMYYDALRKGTRYYKEEGGQRDMSEMLDNYVKARVKEVEEKYRNKQIENIRNLMNNLKWSLDEAMQALGISAEDQEAIRPMFR